MVNLIKLSGNTEPPYKVEAGVSYEDQEVFKKIYSVFQSIFLEVDINPEFNFTGKFVNQEVGRRSSFVNNLKRRVSSRDKIVRVVEAFSLFAENGFMQKQVKREKRVRFADEKAAIDALSEKNCIVSWLLNLIYQGGAATHLSKEQVYSVLQEVSIEEDLSRVVQLMDAGAPFADLVDMDSTKRSNIILNYKEVVRFLKEGVLLEEIVALDESCFYKMVYSCEAAIELLRAEIGIEFSQLKNLTSPTLYKVLSFPKTVILLHSTGIDLKRIALMGEYLGCRVIDHCLEVLNLFRMGKSIDSDAALFEYLEK